ncbi:hypothetical protein B0H66DRAFT_347004 [Apodospora peruviana]|uniref:AAA+ ATPase domain-containing protein n=1 Tax=Apodospora peruviana TaxID=516989 RepID=A0AAE0HZ45_9PEZI|nr:hypothetical protein B0H66DRAFT_347004 [Apodospora peruviana]
MLASWMMNDPKDLPTANEQAKVWRSGGSEETMDGPLPLANNSACEEARSLLRRSTTTDKVDTGFKPLVASGGGDAVTLGHLLHADGNCADESTGKGKEKEKMADAHLDIDGSENGADDGLNQFDFCDTTSQGSQSPVMTPFTDVSADKYNQHGDFLSPSCDDDDKKDDDDDNDSISSDSSDSSSQDTLNEPGKVYYAVIDPVMNHDLSCHQRVCIVYSYQELVKGVNEKSDENAGPHVVSHFVKVSRATTIPNFLDNCGYNLAFIAVKEYDSYCPCRLPTCLAGQHSIWPLSAPLRHDFFNITKTCPFSVDLSSLRPSPPRPMNQVRQTPYPHTSPPAEIPGPLGRRTAPVPPVCVVPPPPPPPPLVPSGLTLPASSTTPPVLPTASSPSPRKAPGVVPIQRIPLRGPGLPTTPPPLSQRPPMKHQKDFILHNHDKFHALLDSDPSRHDLAAMLHFFSIPSRCLFSAEWRKRGEQLRSGEVDAEAYKSLFCGDELVIYKQRHRGIGDGKTEETLMAFVLTGKPSVDPVKNQLKLNGWRWMHNGETGLERRSFSASVDIPEKGEVKKVVDMDAYPVRRATNDVGGRLAERGRKWWALFRDEDRKGVPVTYEGWEWLREKNYPTDSRFMVDNHYYRKCLVPGDTVWIGAPITAKMPDDTKWPVAVPVTQRILRDDVAMLLPPEVIAWCLTERGWIRLHIDKVRAVTYDPEAFSRLALPQPTKELVEALIVGRVDKVNKEEPLVVHFRGPSGTGKTAAAKAIAERAAFPLCHIKSGDIPAWDSPEKLSNFFRVMHHVGSAWHCILLLDESDNWLDERRSMLDRTDHSILVDGFANLLGTYPGTVIITSNRTEMVDTGIKSRIHVSLSFPALDRWARGNIWSDEVGQRKDRGEMNEELFKGFEAFRAKLGARELNGHQIKAAIDVACQVARWRGTGVDWSILEMAEMAVLGE